MKNRLTFELIFYLLAFSAALFLRFYNLGGTPLNELEAFSALQALGIFTNQPASQDVISGSQSAYFILTGLLFATFEAANFLARFWPALAGSLLVISPVFFRQYFGKTACLIFAFGLAFDPGLVTISRQANGIMMALSFTVIALGLWLNQRTFLAGIVGGLALLTGSPVIPGILSLILTVLGLISLQKLDRVPKISTLRNQVSPISLWKLLLGAGATILIAGSVFLRIPQGLSAWFNALPDFLTGWLNASGVPLSQMILALIVFQPLALIFGGLRSVRLLGSFSENKAEENPPPDLPQVETDQASLHLISQLFLFLNAIFSLCILLFYPSRQVADLVWVLIPLWGLAALELDHYLTDLPRNWIAAGQAVLFFLLAALSWLTLAALSRSGAGIPGSETIRFGLIVGIFGLAALTTLLVSLGWSWRIARQGLVWGSVSALCFYLIAAGWGAAQLRQNMPQELWGPAPATDQADLLVTTLQDLSKIRTGFPHEIGVVVLGDSAALRWLLRDFKKTRFANILAPDELPDTIVAPLSEEDPLLTASYSGQDFALQVYPGWEGASPPNFIRWLVFREAPLAQNQFILWARADIFPGDASEQ